MKRITVFGLIVACALGGQSLQNQDACAQDIQAKDTNKVVKPKVKRKTQPAFLPPEVNHRLPSVLLLGDSISIGYMLDVRRQLAGKANVWRPPTNCGPTIRGLESLDKWLGQTKWDVIHFNFGLPNHTNLRIKKRCNLLGFNGPGGVTNYNLRIG